MSEAHHASSCASQFKGIRTMQIHVRNQTYEIDVGLAFFLLGLYVGIDLHTVYVYLGHMIRAVLDRASGSGEARTSERPLGDMGRPHAPMPRPHKSRNTNRVSTAATLAA